MSLDYNQILAESKDVKTQPKRLDEIYHSLRDSFPKAQKNQIIEAIGLNPNTDYNTIKIIFQKYGGMADKIIQHNPAIPLLQLSKPDILKDWILERSHPIFYNVSTSYLLQEIAFSTEDTKVYANLANSKHVAKEIIEAIANDTDFSEDPDDEEELRLRQELIKNQHTPVQVLLDVVQEERDTQDHENAWININSCPNKKQEAIKYFESLNSPEKTWAENCVGKIEALLEKGKNEGALDEGEEGYQSFLYDDEYKIEVIPEAGIKALHKGEIFYSRRLIFNYDIQSLQVFVSMPTEDDIKFWNNV